MLKFSNLKNISTDVLLQVFNEAFSDYAVKMELTKDQLETKLLVNSVDLQLSVGAFEDGQLIGFMLHGVNIIKDKKVIYNAGTGVIPSKRGNDLTKQMYKFITPVLEKTGAKKFVLEALQRNFPAIRSYTAAGFTFAREFICLKGTPNVKKVNTELQAAELKTADFTKGQLFWDWEPSWQNSTPVLQNPAEPHKGIGLYLKKELVAYAIYNPENNRVAQFGVHKSHRRKGYGTILFQHLSEILKSEITVLNVDIDHPSSLHFLGSVNIVPHLNQYEMERKL